MRHRRCATDSNHGRHGAATSSSVVQKRARDAPAGQIQAERERQGSKDESACNMGMGGVGDERDQRGYLEKCAEDPLKLGRAGTDYQALITTVESDDADPYKGQQGAEDRVERSV